MTRLKRQIITLALALGAVIAAKVYLNRKIAQGGFDDMSEPSTAAEPAPSANEVTIEGYRAPAAATPPASRNGPIAKSTP